MTEGSRRRAGFYDRPLRARSVDTGRRWRHDDPAAGHRGVTALVGWDVSGGDIPKTGVDAAPHSRNRIEGDHIDFTMRQFNRPIRRDDIPKRPIRSAGRRPDGRPASCFVGQYADLTKPWHKG